MENKERFKKINSILPELIIQLENYLLSEIILNDEFVDSLWEIQSNLEYSILMFKLCLDDDIDFSSQRDPKITDPKEMIHESLQAIKNTLQYMKNDDNIDALNSLRYGSYLIKNTIAKIRIKH